MRALWVLALGVVLGCGCNPRPGRFPLGFERMRDQQKYLPYGSSEFFDDGMAMRTLPPGAVAEEQRGGESGAEARADESATVIPIDVDAAAMTRGQERFDVFCSPCHGVDGSADTTVAHAMSTRPPPALTSARVRALPVGAIYRAVSRGYGFMPSYARQLPPADRWAVIAYVRALQTSSGIALSALPEDARREAETALGDGSRR